MHTVAINLQHNANLKHFHNTSVPSNKTTGNGFIEPCTENVKIYKGPTIHVVTIIIIKIIITTESQASGVIGGRQYQE